MKDTNKFYDQALQNLLNALYRQYWTEVEILKQKEKGNEK